MLIEQFLQKHRALGDIGSDIDLEMDEVRFNNNKYHEVLSVRAESPRVEQSSITRKDSQTVSVGDTVIEHENIDVSDENCKESIRQRRREHEDDTVRFNRGGAGTRVNSGEVLKCSSNASVKQNSSVIKMKKTKSRLMDPPSLPKEKGRKSGLIRSGFMGRRSTDEEEDDPFADIDLPEHYNKSGVRLLVILEWVTLILTVGAFVCGFAIPSIKKNTLWELKLWKWEVLVLVVICGRLVSGWGIWLAVFFSERSCLLKKRILYFIYAVKKAVQNCVWLCLVLIAWHFLFDKKVKQEVNNKILRNVTRILVSLLVATLLWLVKTLFVKILSSSFHVSTYFDRIQESLFNQYVIEKLSGSPYIEILNTREEEEKIMIEIQKLQKDGASIPAQLRASVLPKSERVIGTGRLQNRVFRKLKPSGTFDQGKDKGLTIDQLHKLNQKNISAWSMKRMMKIIRHGVLSTLDEKMYSSTHEGESSKEIKSECEAIHAAKKIFDNVAKPWSNYIYLDDVMRFLKEDEAEKAMSLFDGPNENMRVSKSALKTWVVAAFKERKALALTLNDTKTAVNQLHHMVSAIMFVIIVVISLLILEIATTSLLVFISSQLLLVAFMFGNTLKMIFEAIIFIFCMHPFDVGDRCEIDGIQMVVEEMNILTTVFLRYDNLKIVYPNSVLSTKPISNYYRSPDMGDGIDFCIHISTPAEKIALMKESIIRYIVSIPEHWYPLPLVVVRDVDNLNRLKLSVWLQHKINHHEMGDRFVRRAALVEEIVKICKDLGIQYRELPMDVNVRNIPVATSTRLPSNWISCTD